MILILLIEESLEFKISADIYFIFLTIPNNNSNRFYDKI